MTFNSVSFFAFFPLAVLVCRLVPRRWQNAALLAVSYAFYCFNTPAWLPVLVLDSLATWALVRRMDAAEGLSRKRRLWAALGVNLGLLVLLKGASLLLHGAAVSAGLWQALSRLGLASEAGGSAFSVILPLGISFFTVQSVGYAVDVYRKKYAAEPSACNFALFVSFFPLISSGPIMRGDKLLPQLRAPRALRTDRAAHALVTFALGLFSKVAVADLLAVFANAVYGDVTAYTGLTLTFGALCYGLQLYFDFSGYSLMALGAAELLGLQLTTNFDTPYFSRSIREFWGRWHISFSSWLKDYVYIPLGGNRKGKARKYLNLLLTFLVSGVWHGVGLTYLIWGALHGVYQIAGRDGQAARTRLRSAACQPHRPPCLCVAVPVHLCAGKRRLGIFPRRFGTRRAVCADGPVSERFTDRPAGGHPRHSGLLQCKISFERCIPGVRAFGTGGRRAAGLCPPLQSAGRGSFRTDAEPAAYFPLAAVLRAGRVHFRGLFDEQRILRHGGEFPVQQFLRRRAA